MSWQLLGCIHAPLWLCQADAFCIDLVQHENIKDESSVALQTQVEQREGNTQHGTPVEVGSIGDQAQVWNRVKSKGSELERDTDATEQNVPIRVSTNRQRLLTNTSSRILRKLSHMDNS